MLVLLKVFCWFGTLFAQLLIAMLLFCSGSVLSSEGKNSDLQRLYCRISNESPMVNSSGALLAEQRV